MAHKGGKNAYKCPKKDDGTNVISAVFLPGEQKMYMAFEYGIGDSYKTACCGVYVETDLRVWFD